MGLNGGRQRGLTDGVLIDLLKRDLDKTHPNSVKKSGSRNTNHFARQYLRSLPIIYTREFIIFFYTTHTLSHIIVVARSYKIIYDLRFFLEEKKWNK